MRLPKTNPAPDPWVHPDSFWDESHSVWAHPNTPDMYHGSVRPLATYSPWLSDQDFLACFEKIQQNTVVDIFRSFELWSIAKQLKEIEGCFLEVGVWQGGSGALLATAAKLTAPDRSVFLADTFLGVVKAGPNDPKFKGGEYANTSAEIVANLINKLNLDNVIILEGVFPDDNHQSMNEPIALLHCDVDVYQSAKDIVEWVLPRLSLGGVIVFDDYGFSGCEGITKYADELGEKSNLLFVHNLNGHALLVKR